MNMNSDVLAKFDPTMSGSMASVQINFSPCLQYQARHTVSPQYVAAELAVSMAINQQSAQDGNGQGRSTYAPFHG